MPEPLRVLVVVGSLNEKSATRLVLRTAAEKLSALGCVANLLDFAAQPLPHFNPDQSYSAPEYARLKAQVEEADVYLLGTPDYHGSMSGTIKNFLDHFWQEFTGKLFATIVASHEKGLTVTDQLRTVARQCYAWSMPYAMSFSDREDLREGQISGEGFGRRLEMFIRDVAVYGRLLAEQRRADLQGNEPGFMARLRQA